MTATRALIREIPDSFAHALVMDSERDLDPTAARQQHDIYRAHLDQAGYEMTAVPADEECPDCVFIEDTVVIVGTVAVLTRPGAPSRRPEVAAVKVALDSQLPTRSIEEPATLDGGDVFTSGSTLYVGLSSRTNQAGVDQLQVIADEMGLSVKPVPVRNTLHLKSAVLPLGEGTVVVTPGCVDEDALDGLRILYEDLDERHRFSALPLRNGIVLVTANALRTATLVAAAGFDPVPIDVSELQAADGGLTCMSVLF